MPTIPRAEIDAIMERYGDSWPLRTDPPVTTVRGVAAGLHLGLGLRGRTDDVGRAEAEALEELCDRIESEVAR